MTIQDLLQDLHVDFLESGHQHTRPGWLQLRHCPFCSSDNYHLGINTTGLFASCYRCGGHHIYAVLERIGVSERELKQVVGQLKGSSVATYKPVKRTGLKEPKGRGPLRPVHKDYLRHHRKFDPEEIERLWHIEGIGLSSRPQLNWRIYIPIFHKGIKVSWTARAIGPQVEPRYLSASPEEEAMNHKSVCYGADYCRHSIVIVEGPTDVWAVGPGAVATFGTAFTTAQVLLFSKFLYRYICFDNEPTAQAKAIELQNQLACFPGLTQNVVLDSKDPGSASEVELRRLRRHAHLTD